MIDYIEQDIKVLTAARARKFVRTFGYEHLTEKYTTWAAVAFEGDYEYIHSYTRLSDKEKSSIQQAYINALSEAIDAVIAEEISIDIETELRNPK